MKLACFQITEEFGFQSQEIDAVSPGLAQEGRSFWIKLEDSDTALLEDFLQPYNLPPWVVEKCLESGWKAGVATFEDGLFFEFPIRYDLDESKLAYVSFICMPRLLITIHRGQNRHLSDAVIELQRDRSLLDASIGALLSWLMDHFFDVNISLFLMLRNHSEKLSDAFDEALDSVDITDIHRLTRKARRIEVMLEDQLYCVHMLKRTKWEGFLPDSLHTSFANIELEYQQVLLEIRRIESRLQELNQRYQVRQQDIMNRRLNVLAIVQSVFVPLTLIAGLYGMNFKYMPELEWAYAYPVLLVGMLFVAIVILWLFYRKGWFD